MTGSKTAEEKGSETEEMTQQNEENTLSYQQITPEEAKAYMDRETDFVLLDVRTAEEFNQEHIPGATLLDNDEILLKAEAVLTRKDQAILVYCRSGRRSKEAAEKLAGLGYTNVMEFGGILDWPYDTVKEGRQ
jgi:rhodanese-related sulfurtransferase